MDETGWTILTIVVAVVVPLSIFAGNRIAKKSDSEKTARIKKLRIHFDDIYGEVIEHISEMARSLRIQHERLVTSYAPISESYPFNETKLYKCFELHFPKEAREWQELNTKAIKLNEDVVNFYENHQYTRSDGKAYVVNEYIKDLQKEMNVFAQTLADKLDSIKKYEMGKEFKKHKKCPICKKF